MILDNNKRVFFSESRILTLTRLDIDQQVGHTDKTSMIFDD